MNQFPNDFTIRARDIRLTDAERSRVRAALMNAMVPSAPVPSPFFIQPFFSRAAAFAVLVIIVGSGTAYAAQSALPGDALYGVKVNVNEPVSGVLAFTDAAKAKWNAAVAESRLQEAEQLAAKGELTATTSSELALDFNEHADAVTALTNTIGATDRDSAADISADFSSSVAAHGAAILAAGKKSDNEVALQASGDLVVNVADDGEDATAPADAPAVMAKMMAPAAFAPAAAPESPDALSLEAHAAFDAASSTVATTTLSGDAANAAEAALAHVANEIVKADAELSIGSTSDAIADFHAALTDITSLNATLAPRTDEDTPDTDSVPPAPSETPDLAPDAESE